MQIAVRHRLSLAPGPGVQRSVQHLLLTPRTGPTQSVLEWSVDLPGIEGAARFADGYGNLAQLVTQNRPGPELVIAVAGIVTTHDRNGVLGRPPGEPVPALFRRQTPATRPVGAISSKFRTLPRAGGDRIGLLHALMARVHEVCGGGEAVQTQSQAQDGQSQQQSPAASRAPAADHAHAFIGTARALDIPARYVAGYLCGESGEAGMAHAWAEAWDDGLGWIAFDPVLNLCPTERHVRVAVGLDATAVPAVRSSPAAGSTETLELTVAPAG